MRSRLCCLRLDRTRTRAICASPYAAAAARFQSIQSLYRAATELHARGAGNAKRRSRICSHVASERILAAYSRSLARSAIRRKTARRPPPGSCPGRSPGAGVLFLRLPSIRIWLWLRVAAGMGRILVSNFALFVIEKLAPAKNFPFVIVQAIRKSAIA
jgi:hypothetical protein